MRQLRNENRSGGQSEYLLLMQWSAPTRRHHNLSIRYIYGPTASYILAFAERQLMANSGSQTPGDVASAFVRKADMGRGRA